MIAEPFKNNFSGKRLIEIPKLIQSFSIIRLGQQGKKKVDFLLR